MNHSSKNNFYDPSEPYTSNSDEEIVLSKSQVDYWRKHSELFHLLDISERDAEGNYHLTRDSVKFMDDRAWDGLFELLKYKKVTDRAIYDYLIDFYMIDDPREQFYAKSSERNNNMMSRQQIRNLMREVEKNINVNNILRYTRKATTSRTKYGKSGRTSKRNVSKRGKTHNKHSRK